MSRYLSLRYDWVILVSGYLVSTAVNDHNIYVQYVQYHVVPGLPNWLESVTLNIGFPVVRTDGRCTVT